MPQDRSAPVYFVRLIEPGKKRGPRIDLTNRVLSFVFEDHEKKADMLRMTVDNWDLANFDTPVWKKGAVLEVSWGYLGNMAPARQVVLKKIKGSTKLQIEAYSTAFLLDTIQKNRCFAELTRSDIVRKIAAENGFGDLQQDIEDTEQAIEHVQQARKTDAAFIRQLADKEGFEFFVDFDGLHFHKRRIDQQPIRDLVWYEDKTGTIKDFDIENDVSSQPMFTVTRGRDPITKKDFEVTSDAKKDIGKLLGVDPEQAGIKQVDAAAMLLISHGAAKLTKKGVRKVGKFQTDKGSSRAIVRTITAKNRLDALRRARGRHRVKRQALVKMKATIIGDPGLVAKSVVKIGGMSKRLSGNYYVKSHRHTLGTSGFVGELTLIRDGHSETNVAASKLFNQPRRNRGAGAGNPNGTCDAQLDTLFAVHTQFRETYDRERNAAYARGFKFDSLVARNVGIEHAVMNHQIARLKSNRRSIPAINQVFDAANTMDRFLPAPQFRGTHKMLRAVRQAASAAATACEEEVRAQNPNTAAVAISPSTTLGTQRTGVQEFVGRAIREADLRNAPDESTAVGSFVAFVFKGGRE